MKSSCIFVLIFLSLLPIQRVYSCDAILTPFPKDCAIQDRYRNLKNAYSKIGISMDEVAEYRALRFIDRASWEKAKPQQIGPRWVYEKKPTTWDQWDQGIRWIEKNIFLEKISTDTFSIINKQLLTSEIQDRSSDIYSGPGILRTHKSPLTGFCYPKVNDFMVEHLKSLEESEKSEFLLWEKNTQLSFSDLVKKSLGDFPATAQNYASISFNLVPNALCDGIWVSYVPGGEVLSQLQMWILYLQVNLKLIKQRQSKLSPIELASDLQKWMIGIHPFSDGNGRVSRALQDLVLKYFDLPFAPAGDLFNDTILSKKEYRELNYQKIEASLEHLESCLKQADFSCQTVQEIRSKEDSQNEKN